MTEVHWRDFGPSDRVLVLTGAGVSAESGIRTFRDAGGLWEDFEITEVASPEGFRRDPRKVWRFYGERRVQARSCQPNPAHRALAALEARLSDRLLLVTQNVDGLHRRAGSRRLIEMHGSLFRSKCTSPGCHGFSSPWDDPEPPKEELPSCPLCGALSRPDIVWFGELLSRANLQSIEAALRTCTVFIAVGTSGAVYPAAGLVHSASSAGAHTILVNKDAAENEGAFDEIILGEAGRVLPILLG